MEFSEHNQGALFYVGISFSFVCYASAYMFTKWDKWRWFPMFVTLICISRFTKEIFFLVFPSESSENYDIFDYINFLITIYIVFMYYLKWQFKQYKNLIR